MKKIVYRTLTTIIILILISIVYLSTVGIKTDKFNYRISSQIKKIDNNLDIRLKEVSIILNPFKFKIDAKTVGSDLIYRDKLIQLDNIKSSISIKSFIDRKFSLTKISVSTKSLDIKNLISFIRLLKKDPKIYIAEQYVKKGYIIPCI